MRWPVGLFLLMSVFSGAALAQSDPDWKICNADDHDAAIAACTRLIGNGKLSKKNLAIAYLNRGVSYERNGEYDKAIADATLNIETDPREAAEGYFNRGFAYKKKGEIEKALNDYNTAIKLKPTYIDPHTNRGVIFVQRGEYDRAVTLAERGAFVSDHFIDENLSAYQLPGKSQGSYARGRGTAAAW